MLCIKKKKKKKKNFSHPTTIDNFCHLKHPKPPTAREAQKHSARTSKWHFEREIYIRSKASIDVSIFSYIYAALLFKTRCALIPSTRHRWLSGPRRYNNICLCSNNKAFLTTSTACNNIHTGGVGRGGGQGRINGPR